MKTTDTTTNQRADDRIAIYRGLGWMTTALDPSFFETFWVNETEGHFISKLRSHLDELKKDTANHFPVEKKEIFQKTIEDFIIENARYRESKGLFKRYFLYTTRQAAKQAYYQTMDLLANCKKKPTEDEEI